jgi:division protein CdvB (Snf7/Vps24/ESCRT-III family)
MVALDWLSQLKGCQIRIAELNEKIASDKLKIERLFGQTLRVASAQRRLAIREESLARVQSCKLMIETRIAESAAYEGRAAPFFWDVQNRALLRSDRDSYRSRAASAAR